MGMIFMKIGRFAAAGVFLAISSYFIASPTAAASECPGDVAFGGRLWTLEVDNTRPARNMWASTRVIGWGPVTALKIGWWEEDYGEDVEDGYEIYLGGTGPATVEIAGGQRTTFTLAKGKDKPYEVQTDIDWAVWRSLQNATVTVSTPDGWRRSIPFPAGFSAAWSTMKHCL